MRLELTPEQQMIQAMAREFAENEVRPIAGELDRDARFPHETVKRMGELGLMGITVSEEWGGSGADTVSYAVAVVEIAKACASHAVIMSVNNSLYCDAIQRFGSHAQKEEFLRPAASGREIGCFALTEPEAGSDATNQNTLARRDGDHYRPQRAKDLRDQRPRVDRPRSSWPRPIARRAGTGSPPSSSARAHRASRW